MNKYTIIAGVNGTGKSSFRGVLEGQRINLGQIIDPDLIAKENLNNLFLASKIAVQKINTCLNNHISFTQETTLGGRTVISTAKKARIEEYNISLYYIGLSSSDESIVRIENRVKKGGHNIPTADVIRRFETRFNTLIELIPLCDEVQFYDNENGFVKVGEILNGTFYFVGNYRPKWLLDFYNIYNSKK